MTVWCGEENRIATAIRAMRDKLVDVPQTRQDQLKRLNAVSMDEVDIFQNWKAIAQSAGIITLDEALTIYAALGEVGEARDNLGWPVDTDLAQRAVVMLFMHKVGTVIHEGSVSA